MSIIYTPHFGDKGNGQKYIYGDMLMPISAAQEKQQRKMKRQKSAQNWERLLWKSLEKEEEVYLGRRKRRSAMLRNKDPQTV